MVKGEKEKREKTWVEELSRASSLRGREMSDMEKLMMNGPRRGGHNLGRREKNCTAPVSDRKNYSTKIGEHALKRAKGGCQEGLCGGGGR